jgi:WD40 repeat protein
MWNPCRLIGALCSVDGIYILDFENGPAQIRRISVSGSPALAVWAPSGDFLASLSINGEVSIRDSRDGSLIWQCGELFPLCKENSSVHVPPPVSLMAWSPCGRELFVSVGGREVLVISTERHLLSARLKCLNNAVSMAISHDGEWCAVRSEAPYGENGQVEIWKRGEWHRPLLKPLSGDSVKYREHGRALEFHPEKPLIASFNNGSWHVNVWRVGNRI